MSLTATERRHALIAKAVPFNDDALLAYRHARATGEKGGEAAEIAVRVHYGLQKFKKVKGQPEYDYLNPLGEAKVLIQGMFQEAGATGDAFKDELRGRVRHAVGAAGRPYEEADSYLKSYMRIENFERIEKNSTSIGGRSKHDF
jgi:hypothetical protein